MRILHVGASGTIGQAVARELEQRHEIIRAGRSSGDLRLDITDPATIRAAFEQAGELDAVVSTAGKVRFAPFAEMQRADYAIGLKDKLMGQVELVLIGREFLRDGGSFTLSTGVLDSDPIREGSSASMVNGAINAFVMAAAIEMPRGLRINAVSAGVIEEAMGDYAPYFRGFEPVPAARAALAFAKSVEGARTGQVFRVV
jgi:NAD(P)-dependent dehydrogenase (short-subunit alcohol dehydrogenase family)